MQRRHLVALFGLSASLLSLAHCSGASGTTPGTTGASDGGGSSDLDAAAMLEGGGGDGAPVSGGAGAKLGAIAPVTLAIARTVDVTITRTGDPASAVALSLSGLPASVTCAGATIAAGATSATVTLVAAAGATQTTTPVTVTVTGKATAGETSTAALALTVIGAPGMLDTAFGVAGVTAPLSQTGSQVTGVGFQKSGAIVAGGYDGSQLEVARYTTAGALDTTFGSGGYTRAAPATATAFGGVATGLGVTSTDALLVGGNFRLGAGPPANGGPHARFTPSGALDTTLNGTGWSGQFTNHFGSGLAIDSVGRTVIVGPKSLIRELADNSLDPAFSASGQFEYLDNRDVEGVAFQADGTIIHVGPNFVAALASANGDVLTTFGTGGTLSSSHGFHAVAVDATDSIFAVGQEGGSQLLVAKVTKTGAMDTTFASSGVLAIHVGDVGQPAQANAVALQKDGKIVVVGNAVSGGRSVMVAVRVLPTGALDTTFAADKSGIAFISPGTTTAGANAVALAADGKIVIGGHGDQDFAIARLWP